MVQLNLSGDLVIMVQLNLTVRRRCYHGTVEPN
jgi:hypothetical protein